MVNGIGIGSGYVYDAMNIVQELVSTSADNSAAANVRASYISGGIDEVFAQLSGTNATARVATYLTDALGSVIGLTDAVGTKVVDYTYGPYGETTADATVNAAPNAAVNNPFQYTGRENDGNGLYYYRARYYSPGMGRFISSDLIGLAGGINTYAYVGGNPISYIDPVGLQAQSIGLLLPPLIVGCGLTSGYLPAVLDSCGRVISKLKDWMFSGDKDANTPAWPGNDPSVAPPGTRWRGKPGSTQGGKDGNYVDTNTAESYRPDLNHSDPIGPHWDHRDTDGNWGRIYPDGTRVPK